MTASWLRICLSRWATELHCQKQDVVQHHSTHMFHHHLLYSTSTVCFAQVPGRYGERAGGYCRVKAELMPRRGDNTGACSGVRILLKWLGVHGFFWPSGCLNGQNAIR